MERSPNQDGTDAEKIKAVAALIDQLRADDKAGKKIDTAAVLQAHLELAPLLGPELEQFQRRSQTRAESSKHTTTFISDEMKTASKPNIEVSGYSVISEIGRGGQAVVYLAVQLSTGRRRALKVLREGRLADAQATARFQREITTLASLQHPNIVPIIDTGETSDGHRFMVMDYIHGTSLDEFMKSRHGSDGDDPSKLLKLFLKLCAAVNVAHRSGIIHRDLKPSNILIDDRGEPHVLDFGLARTALDRFIRGDSGQVSVTGEFLGSLPWSSPEQAEGDPDRIDIRTDVYSLGVILYQILTGGRFPYEVVGNIRDVLNNILTAQPTPPTKVLAAALARESRVKQQAAPRTPPIVNSVIEQIVLKALAKKPESRYQTAGELGRDISNYLNGRPTARATATASATTQTTVVARGGGWKYAAMSAGVAAAFTIGAFLFLQRHSNPPSVAAVPPAVAEAAPVALAAAPAVAPQAPPAATMPVLASALSAALPQQAGAARNLPAETIVNGAARLEGGELALTPRMAGSCGFFFGDSSWSNYELTFKAIANSTEGFNVWFHWTSPGNFVGVSPANPILPDLWVRHDGQFDRLRIRKARIEPDRWHDIRLVVHGPDFTCFVDGEEWFQALDARYTHGRVALTTRNAAARFRDIRVTAPDGSVMFGGGPLDLSRLPAGERDTGSAASPTALKRVDLLKLVDPAKNAVSGVWSVKDGALSNAAGGNAQIEFPYTPGDEYDYRIQLKRLAGAAPISLICIGGGHEFSWVMGGQDNSVSGLAMVEGKNFDDNTSTTRGRPLLVNGMTHLLVVTVRKEIVRAFVDGVQHSILRTDFKNLTIDPALLKPGKMALGLRCEGDSVSVPWADVLEVPREAVVPQ